MSFIFDSDLIPELPQPGISVTHHELMGWKHPAPPDIRQGENPSNPTNEVKKGKNRKPGSDDKQIDRKAIDVKANIGRVSNSLNEKTRINHDEEGLRVKVLRRVSSLSDKQRSGINPINGIELGNKLKSDQFLPSTKKRVEGNLIKQSSEKIRSTHRRSASWSITPKAESPPSSSTSSKLISKDTSIDIPKTLTNLFNLIPLSRLNINQSTLRLESPNDLLDPSLLILGLSFILECLVTERTTLQTPSSSPSSGQLHHSLSLPILRSGISIQLPPTSGGIGQLNWTEFNQYIQSFGYNFHIINNVLSSMEITPDLLDLIDKLKVYVIKIKKVFGEVAELYMDNYGSLDGWWDEGLMRGCATNIGSWSNVVFLQ